MPLLNSETISEISKSYARECQRYNIDFSTETPCLVTFQQEAWQVAPNVNRIPSNLCCSPMDMSAVLSEREATSHFMTSGTFKKGTLDSFKGRTEANLARILYLVFDCDLKHFVEDTYKKKGVEDVAELMAAGTGWDELVWKMPDLANWLETQKNQIIQLFTAIGLPYSRIIRSGYGHYILIDLDQESGLRIGECKSLSKDIISVVNKMAGLRLIDPGVCDPGTRFTRIPGSLNLKDPDGKIQKVCIVDERSEWEVYSIDKMMKVVGALLKTTGQKSAQKVKGKTHEEEEEVVDDVSSEFEALRAEAIPKIVDLFTKYWNSSGTHKICRPLAGFLRKRPEGWTLPEVNGIMWDLAKKSGYEGQTFNLQPNAIIKEVADTFSKQLIDKDLKGISGLKEILTTKELGDFLEIFKNFNYNLRDDIDRVLNDKKMNITHKKEALAKLTFNFLFHTGRFVLAKDGSAYFFDLKTKELFDMAHQQWSDYLAYDVLQGIGDKDPMHIHVKAAVQNFVSRTIASVEVVQFSHWDRETGVLRVAINNSEYVCISATGYELKTNGEEEIFFEKDRNIGVKYKELLEDCPPLPKDYYAQFLVEPLSFSPSGMLTVDQAKLLWKKAILGIFFRAALYTRPIIWFTGPAKSGKTTASRLMLRSFFGGGHILSLDDVSGLPLDPMNGNFTLISKLEVAPVASFDNYDVRLPWIVEKLCRYATGCTEEYRVLYSQRIKRFRVTSQIMMTSIVPPARESDLIDRTVFFEFENPKETKPDENMYRNVDVNRVKILRSILDTIKDNIVALQKEEELPKGFAGAFRMVSWAELLMRLSSASERKTLADTFKALKRFQSDMAAENEPIVAVLMDWMREQDATTITISAVKLMACIKSELEGAMGEAYKRVGTFTAALIRAKPTLAQHGIKLDKKGTDDGKAIFTISLITDPR